LFKKREKGEGAIFLEIFASEKVGNQGFLRSRIKSKI